MNVSVLASSLIGSEIIKIGNEVNEMKRKGAQIANLTIGDFDPTIFPIPEELKDGIVDAYNAHQTNYPPADGILPLRETISEMLKDRFQLDYKTSEILVSGGSRPLIYATYLALIDPGDTVVFPAPSWNNNHYCHLTSATPIAVETDAEHNFMPTAEQLKPHLKGATLLALCSPLNPTGTMFTADQLAEICDLVIEENHARGLNEKPLYMMYDQIYSLLTFGIDHVNPVSLRPEIRDYVIFVDGSSKCLAATGVRVGWGFGPADMGAWAPKAEQVAMAGYFGNKKLLDSFLTSFKSKIQDSLDALYEGFLALKSEGYEVDAVQPMGAIYLTIKINYIGKSTAEGDVLTDIAAVNFYLIKEANVALVPFSAFGNDDSMPWYRASVGACTLQDIKDMLPRIKTALDKLK
jgi:aspartate aminotransferase